MIGILSYGLGNVSAFSNAFDRLGIPSFIVGNDFLNLDNLDGLILPGVGSFDDAIKKIEDAVLFGEIMEKVKNGLPVLGVCVGMQLLFDKSEEGKLPGLGLISGQVKKFSKSNSLRLPHLGPNVVNWEHLSPLKVDDSDNEFYFLHGYYCVPSEPENIIGLSEYGITFASAVQNKNIFGVQFHPEKSHENGAKVLQHFANFCKQI